MLSYIGSTVIGWESSVSLLDQLQSKKAKPMQLRITYDTR